MDKNEENELFKSKTEKEEILVETKDDTDIDITSPIEEDDYIFVKKFLKTKHAIIFRFSNKIIQVCFQDHTQIVIHPLNKNVTYTNKVGKKEVFPLNKALNSSNQEMNKRIKYTKEILTHMIYLNKKKLENK